MARSDAPVLVAGAINTDLVATMGRAPAGGETITGASFVIHGGGKAANQAVAVSRAGARAVLVSALGNDGFGHARRADLEREAIATDWILVDPGVPSGVALIFVEEGGENRIVYIPGATSIVPPSHVEHALAVLQPSWVLATNELPQDALRALFRAARMGSAAVVFNATPEPETAVELLADVDILIVNEGEAASLLGMRRIDDWPAALRALRERGIGTVILTVGKDGALAANANGLIHHRPPIVDVVDTTGAGDAFCGALVASLAGGADLDEAVRFGVRASALSVTRAGAQPSMPRREDVLRLT